MMPFDPHTLLAVDVETSGPDPFRHQLLAAAFVPFDESKPALEVFVRPPNVEWTDVARRYFGGYQHQWEQAATPPANAYKLIVNYLETFSVEMTLVGHNVGFDYSFLKQLVANAGQARLPLVSHRSVDTHSLLKLLYWMDRIPESACSSDGALAHFGVVVPVPERHTALGDARVTVKLASAIYQEFGGLLDEQFSRTALGKA